MGVLVQRKLYMKSISYKADLSCGFTEVGVSTPQHPELHYPPTTATTTVIPSAPEAPLENCHQFDILSFSPNASFFSEERKARGSSVRQSSHVSA